MIPHCPNDGGTSRPRRIARASRPGGVTPTRIEPASFLRPVAHREQAVEVRPRPPSRLDESASQGVRHCRVPAPPGAAPTPVPQARNGHANHSLGNRRHRRGICTRQDLHWPVVVDQTGHDLGTEAFSTTRADYRPMLSVVALEGRRPPVGVESTRSLRRGRYLTSGTDGRPGVPAPSRVSANRPPESGSSVRGAMQYDHQRSSRTVADGAARDRTCPPFAGGGAPAGVCPPGGSRCSGSTRSRCRGCTGAGC